MHLVPVVIIASVIAFTVYPAAPHIFQRQETRITIQPKVMPTPTPTPTDKEVIDEITRVFEPEGKHIIVRAINCFYSESGLRWDAVGTNKNGTHDGGVSQINDVHGLTLDERLDYKVNIQKAYEIYLRNGSSFRPWYAIGCR